MKLKTLISEDIINEGHSGEMGPIEGNPKTQKDALKIANELIADGKQYNSDMKHFMGAKFVGTVSEDRLDKFATKYEDDYVAVGIVDGAYWLAYWFRT